MSRAPGPCLALCGLLTALPVAAAPAPARPLPGLCTRADGYLGESRDGALLAEVRRSLPPAPRASLGPLPATRAATGPPPAPRPLLSAHFAELGDLGIRLRALRHFSVLRLWDSPHVRVFLGVDRSGRAGLHIQERDPREWPLPRLAAAPIDWPIRAVPLSSP